MSNDPYPRGTEEFITATAVADRTLAAQTVEIAISRGDTHVWLPAEWIGDPATTRKARTVDTVVFGDDYPRSTYEVFVRVSDSPEVPIMRAGVIKID